MSTQNVLMRLHGFVDPAERIIESRIHGDGLGFDYKTMKRLPHLEEDLAFLGVTKGEVRQLPTCDDLATLDTLPKAIGVLYLFEGSRLGGQGPRKVPARTVRFFGAPRIRVFCFQRSKRGGSVAVF